MDYVAAIAPSIGVLALFVIAMRGIFRADQRERLAQAQIERAEQAEHDGTRYSTPSTRTAVDTPRSGDSSENQAAAGGTE